MRTGCGRLKSDYRYPEDIIFNTPSGPLLPGAKKVEQTARAIPDAHVLCPDSSLADLYDKAGLAPEPRGARRRNGRAMTNANGMSNKETTEDSCVEELTRRQQAMIGSECGDT